MARIKTHPGQIIKAELATRRLSANRLALDLGVPSGRIVDILNGKRSVTPDTALRLSRYFGNSAQFRMNLQTQYDLSVAEAAHGAEIATRVARAAE